MKHNLINNLIQYLDLKKPINIRISPRKCKEADAYYEPVYYQKTTRLKEHQITIYLKDKSRDFDTLIAHELIHAWQEEHKLTEIHGEEFIKYANNIQQDFKIKDIYLEMVDE